MVLETHMKLIMGKNGGKGPKMGQKWRFLKLLKNLITICAIIKIPYLGKMWFLGYGPKCFKPIRLQDF